MLKKLWANQKGIIMKFWQGFEKQWTIIGVIIAIAFMGFNFAKYMQSFTNQITNLTLEMQKLTSAVERINGIDDRLSEVENEVDNHSELIIGRAVLIIVNMESGSEFDVMLYPSARAELQFVCNDGKYKEELVQRVGELIATRYCNIVNR